MNIIPKEAEEALERVKRWKLHYNQCRLYSLCPYCGTELKLKYKTEGWFVFKTRFRVYSCTKCKFSHKEQLICTRAG